MVTGVLDMDELDAFSIGQFCARHGFSRGQFYQLSEDERPRTYHIGRRIFISREAAEEWRRHMEAKECNPPK